MRGLGGFNRIATIINLRVSRFCLDPCGRLTVMIVRVHQKYQRRIIGDGVNTVSFCSKLRTAAALIVCRRTGADTGGRDFCNKCPVVRMAKYRMDHIAALRAGFGRGLRCRAAGGMVDYGVMLRAARGPAKMGMAVCILIAPR